MDIWLPIARTSRYLMGVITTWAYQVIEFEKSSVLIEDKYMNAGSSIQERSHTQSGT